jgi:predicted DNA binding CopG/RHH family protein
MNREPKPIDSPGDIPAGLSDEERMGFLEEHGVTEHFLENVEEATEEERPRPRTRSINVRFDDFTLGRLKALAGSRNVGYQTLLKTFVQERLYEEEKRRWTTPTQEAPVEQPTKQRTGDWLDEVHEYIRENEELLEDPEFDSVTSFRLASDSASMLKEISDEIRDKSREKGFPATKLRRLVKAYEMLKPFVERVIEVYHEMFETEGSEDHATAGTYSEVREAERIVEESG